MAEIKVLMLSYFHAGVFPQKCVRISVRVQSQDCVATSAAQVKSPRTRHKLRRKLRHRVLEMRETLRTSMFQVCVDMFAGMFADTFADTFAHPFVDKCCAHCVRVVCATGICREGLMAVYRSCSAEQTHTMEVLVQVWLVQLMLLPRLGKETEQGPCKQHRQKPPPANHERMPYLMAKQ